MYYYNVTVNLEIDIVNDWLEWMQNHHIPEVMATGHFNGYKIAQLLEPAPEPNTVTYIIQYEIKSLESLEIYRETAMSELQKAHNERYKNKFVAFRSVFQVL
jgi:hypothetical protein